MEDNCSVITYLIDKNGQLIFISTYSNKMQNLPNLAQKENLNSNITEVPIEGVQAFISEDFTPFQYLGIKNVTGEQVLVLGTREVINVTGWGVLVEQPVKIIIYQAYSLILVAGFVVFLIVITTILTGWYIINKIIQPLNILRNGVAMLAQGNFDHKIEIFAKDEIGFLADDFNKMSIALFESQQSLADAAEENAQLYKEEQRRVNELALVNQINHTVMASLDLETTIDAVLRNLETLLDYAIRRDKHLGC